MKTETTSMTEGSPVKLILAFSAPLLLGNIFQQLYNLVDSTVVGRFVGANALAAVGAPGTIMALTLCLCFGLTNGAGIIIAQCFGAKNYNQLKATIGALICIISITALVLMIIGIAGAPFFLRLVSTPDEIINDAVLYMRIVMIGTPFSMAYNGASAILRNMGDSKTPLLMLMLSSFLNIVLDLIFVLAFGMAVMGVGIATVISQAVSAAACLIYMRRYKNELHLDGLKIRFNRRCAKQIFKTGVPTALQSCMISLGTLSVQRLINSFGTQAVAAYTASTKIDSVAIMVVVTMGMSLAVYSGQNMGAGKVDRIKSGLYKTLALVLTYCVIMAIVMIFFGNNLLRIFLDPSEAGEAVSIGTQYLRIIGIAYFMAGIMRCYLNVVHGTGDVNISMLTGLAELAFRIIASYILVKPLGLTGLWIAIPISWCCGSLIPVIRYYSGKWKYKSLV
ncbi:MAG: MATE family efflux transporter [Monoglobales bacterium]